MITYHTITIEMSIHLYSLIVWIIQKRVSACVLLSSFLQGIKQSIFFHSFFLAFQASTICPRLELEPLSIYPVIIGIFQGFTVEWKRKRANTHDCILYFSDIFFFWSPGEVKHEVSSRASERKTCFGSTLYPIPKGIAFKRARVGHSIEIETRVLAQSNDESAMNFSVVLCEVWSWNGSRVCLKWVQS